MLAELADVAALVAELAAAVALAAAFVAYIAITCTFKASAQSPFDKSVAQVPEILAVVHT